MANYDSLINAVKAAVKTNGTGAITGATLQATLLGTIEELIVGFQFMGVATPETTPDSNDKKEFYLGFAGTYANFGSSVTVPEGSIILFKKDDGAWSSQVVKIADPVSVSQNTGTGGYDLSVGSDTYNIAAQKDTTDLDAIVKNHTKITKESSVLKHYDSSDFQNGYINPDTGQNATLAYNHIRSESIFVAKEDFYLLIPENISGIIYYYSGYALNTFTKSVELVNNVAYYIPVGTYYRLSFCYSDGSEPDIDDIISDVEQLYHKNNDVEKLTNITSKKFDESLFQRGSISTVNGTNGNDLRKIRTSGLETAKETFLISLPNNIQGTIYYFSEFSYASYMGYADLQPNSLIYVGKGTYYRLSLWYTAYEHLSYPEVGDIINSINITYNFIDKIDSLDLNAENSQWYVRELSVSTGESVTNNKRITCFNLKRHELSVIATGGYAFSIYVYGNSGYLGCLNENNVLSTDTIKWWKSFDLTDLSSKHPEYKFNIVACRVDSTNTPIEDVLTVSESSNIKLFTPYEANVFREKTFCPLVSFIDDDLPPEAVENWYSICNDTGIRIGFAVPTGEMSAEMWEEIRRLQSDGFDFISHTHNHINLMNETDADVIRADLQMSIDSFNNNGVKIKGLVYPQSSISQMALGIVKQYFEYSFNGVDGIQSIQGNPLRQHNITRSNTVEPGMSDYTDPDTGITYQVHAMLPLATLKTYIDKAVEENCWVIFETHFRNSMTTGEGNDGFNFTPEMRQETIDLIKYALSKGCKVVTPSEGYEILKNRFMMGVYASNNYHIIDHNGFVYRKNM